MKALVLEEYMKFVYKEVDMPVCGDDEVLVQVKACGICGSDAHGMDGSTGRRIPPIIMGHEAAGAIIETGKNVSGWQAGDRVTFDSTIYKLDDWYTRQGLYNLSDGRMVLGVSCDDYRRHGAFAEYITVPQHILYKLPENVTFNQAAMVEPVAVALHAVELTQLKLNDTAVVIGAGIIGLFIVQALRAKGAGTIIAIDLKDDRLNMAKKLGADVVINAKEENSADQVRSHANGRGADVAFEVVGIEPTINTAIDCARRGATVTLVGNVSPTVNLPLQKIVTQQIRLQGSCAITGEYPAVLDMIERGSIDVDSVMSAAAPLSRGAEWFKRVYNQEPGLMKVVLNP